MTLTEDELARPLTALREAAQDLIDFYDGGGFRANFPEDHFARLRSALRDTPVADTAGPEAPLFFEPCRDFDKPQSCYTNDGTGLWCDPCRERRRVALVADTAGLDAAWREAEAALPEGWLLSVGSIHRTYPGKGRTVYWAGAGPVPEDQELLLGGKDSPATALLVLAAALRTPKP